MPKVFKRAVEKVWCRGYEGKVIKADKMDRFDAKRLRGGGGLLGSRKPQNRTKFRGKNENEKISKLLAVAVNSS